MTSAPPEAPPSGPFADGRHLGLDCALVQHPYVISNLFPPTGGD